MWRNFMDLVFGPLGALVVAILTWGALLYIMSFAIEGIAQVVTDLHTVAESIRHAK